MSIWKIAYRSIQQRSLPSALTALSMALGVALVVAVLVMHGMISKSFMTGAGLGYNVIIGADKGGKLQLVLNTVYYLSSPVENLPYSFYKEFTEGKYKGYVAKAVPVCLGDYYDDFRVVGTTPKFFEDLTYDNGRAFTFAEGGNFKHDEFFTGVIGSQVARQLGLKVGSTFTPTHGVKGEEDHDHDPFKVVGVLAPTGTPNDRALFINMEGFYLTGGHAKPVEKPAPTKSPAAKAEPHDHADDEPAKAEEAVHEHEPAEKATEEAPAKPAEGAVQKMSDKAAGQELLAQAEPSEHAQKEHDHADHDHADHDHEHGHHHHEPVPDEQREITAILVMTSAPPGAPPALIAQDLISRINEGAEGQAVMPIREISILFQLFVEPVKWLLLGLTVLIVIVAGIGILVSIYNSMSERKRDIAVMRALGAGRSTVMLIVLAESVLLALAGGLLGWMLGHVLIWALNPILTAQTGVGIGLFQFVPLELVIIPGLMVLAAIVGYLPALVAYRTDVAKALSASP